MATPAKVNFKMYQGSTFNEVIRWESNTTVFNNITGITKAAPPVVTSIAHGIPTGWRVLITGVSGMKEINDSNNYLNVTSTTADTLTLGEVNAANFSTYTTGGVITHNAPVDLTGYTAKMQLRSKITDALPIIELNTSTGGITLDPILQTITISLSATATAAFTFSTAVYSLELINAGVVTTIMSGSITLVPEVTR